MAIDYTKIGWDTSKYVNPTNMNQMDNGIKAACDGVDTLNAAIAGYVKLSNAGRQTIVNTSSDLITAFKSNSTSKGLISFLGSDNTTFGHIGVNSSKKPIFNSGTAEDEIALMSNVVKLTVSDFEKINSSNTAGTVIGLNAVTGTNPALAFFKNNGWLASIGVNGNENSNNYRLPLVTLPNNVTKEIPLASRFLLHAGNTSFDSKINVNATSGGGAVQVLWSSHTNNGDSTQAGLAMIRLGYDGNHATKYDVWVNGLDGTSSRVFSISVSANNTLVFNFVSGTIALAWLEIIYNRAF